MPSAEQKTVYMPCADIGHGNPATLLAASTILSQAGYQTTVDLLNLDSAKAFHERMTSSPILTRVYNTGLGELARKVGASRIGGSTKGNFTSNPADLLVAVQEHALAGFRSPAELTTLYPQGQFLIIPDVQMHDSAIDIARRTGLTALVWNTHAATELDRAKLKYILTQPVLPETFINPGDNSDAEDCIVVKSSGTKPGMQPEYLRNLQAALKEFGKPFKMFILNKIITNETETTVDGPSQIAIKNIFQELGSSHPRVFISLPSEMIQFTTGFSHDIAHLLLPPRGPHEVINRKWAEEKGLVAGSLNPSDKTDLLEKIKAAWDKVPTRPNRGDLGLGEKSLVEAIA